MRTGDPKTCTSIGRPDISDACTNCTRNRKCLIRLAKSDLPIMLIPPTSIKIEKKVVEVSHDHAHIVRNGRIINAVFRERLRKFFNRRGMELRNDVVYVKKRFFGLKVFRVFPFLKLQVRANDTCISAAWDETPLITVPNKKSGLLLIKKELSTWLAQAPLPWKLRTKPLRR